MTMTAQTIAGPAMRVRGLEKSYGKLEVLRGVDFDVAPGSASFALSGSLAARDVLTAGDVRSLRQSVTQADG
ncbi:hypothetical protein ACFYZ2_36320 [Streptomyces sviceus]|uniref:hypothetical protein n=1 Tax=Streptomyces sviceus TaxID=285530 RepID=UPI0036A664C5